MNFDLLSQRLIENANILEFYKKVASANSNSNLLLLPQASMDFQHLLIKTRAAQLAQIQQQFQLLNQTSCLPTQDFSLLNRSPPLFSSLTSVFFPTQELKPVEFEMKSEPAQLIFTPSKQISAMNSLTKSEPSFKEEQLSAEINKLESRSLSLLQEKEESELPSASRGSKREHLDFEIFLRKELEKMIKFILSNISKSQPSEIEAMRSRYTNYPGLLQAYDTLVKKYFSSRKVKEEMIRYIIRKALKVMKTYIKEKEKVRGKKASLILCKRYFPAHFDRMEESNVNFENEEELVKFFMPYNKESKNRTININFMLELFSSEQFVTDYMKFLPSLDVELVEDNNKKLQKLVNVLMECIKCNNFENIGSLRVFPWLDTWIEETRSIANSIVFNKGTIYNCKKLKVSP